MMPEEMHKGARSAVLKKLMREMMAGDVQPLLTITIAAAKKKGEEMEGEEMEEVEETPEAGMDTDPRLAEIIRKKKGMAEA